MPGITPRSPTFARPGGRHRLHGDAAGRCSASPAGRSSARLRDPRRSSAGCVSREFSTMALRRTSPVTDVAARARPPRARALRRPGRRRGRHVLHRRVRARDDGRRHGARARCSASRRCRSRSRRSTRQDIGISDADLARVKQRAADGVDVLGLRFTCDRLVPGERFETLREELGDRFIAVEIDSSEGNPHGIPKTAHSVLTEDLVDEPGHPTHDALEQVLDLFRPPRGGRGCAGQAAARRAACPLASGSMPGSMPWSMSHLRTSATSAASSLSSAADAVRARAPGQVAGPDLERAVGQRPERDREPERGEPVGDHADGRGAPVEPEADERRGEHRLDHAEAAGGDAGWRPARWPGRRRPAGRPGPTVPPKARRNTHERGSVEQPVGHRPPDAPADERGLAASSCEAGGDLAHDARPRRPPSRTAGWRAIARITRSACRWPRMSSRTRPANAPSSTRPTMAAVTYAGSKPRAGSRRAARTTAAG